MSKVLAFDFGASSGRAMLFKYNGKTVEMEEMHRFSNDPVEANGEFKWDILRLFHEIKQGIIKTLNAGHSDIKAIGIDTWGVDYGMFDRAGKLITNPFNYRDKRTDGMISIADSMVGKKYIFERTGIQFNFFNTIFQLLSMTQNGDPVLEISEKLLFIPDIFNYFLTGEMKNEYTIASTSQLLNPYTKLWDDELIDNMGFNRNWFGSIIKPGEIVGYLTDELCEELGCPKIPVIAVGSHDTASAVASVPVEKGENYAYISSGTWALMGIERTSPLINDVSYKFDFTNEGGVNDTIRFLKNIMGLWIIQESRRQWQREGRNLSFAEMENQAWQADELISFIDPDYKEFAVPGNMPKRIAEFCLKTGQQAPQNIGETVRTIAQSLAMKCAYFVKCLEEIEGRKIDTIHMVGGGIKDTMVCKFISNATGKRVVAGPVEATSIGNALVQFMALDEIENLEAARDVVKNSFDTVEYLPQDHDKWSKAYERFVKVLRL